MLIIFAGVKVMETISLQCNNLSQYYIQVFTLSMTDRAAYMGVSAEPSLAEIHQEMSELLYQKRVNAQK